MEISVRTKYDSGEMLVDINIENMNAVSLAHLNVEEIRAMIKPQAKFIFMHCGSTANEQSAETLSHALVYGVTHTQASVQADGKEAGDSDC